MAMALVTGHVQNGARFAKPARTLAGTGRHAAPTVAREPYQTWQQFCFFTSYRT